MNAQLFLERQQIETFAKEFASFEPFLNDTLAEDHGREPYEKLKRLLAQASQAPASNDNLLAEISATVAQIEKSLGMKPGQLAETGRKLAAGQKPTTKKVFLA